ncbi:MAG TPA: response regulator [Polyangia bacterium]|nr:response regulator [Polyangia bacterium]
MSRDDEFQRTFADICVLFELALSVGQSLELRENCERFLATLMARKNLGYAAVWLRSAHWPGRPTPEGALALAYAVPRVHIRERVLLEDRFSAAARVPISLAASDPDFAACVTELGIDGGVYAIFPLGNLGFLKLHSAVRQTRFSETELNQLDTVARKFTLSLEGCIAHETAVQQVSERERAEREREVMREQLQQSQKLEAIGRLAGGVAHDFNNLLTTIRGHAELLRRGTTEDTTVRRDLDAILTASKRAAELTGQLLAFSRRGKLRAEDVNLDKLIEEVARLLSHTVDPRIEIVCRFGLMGAAVTGDPSRLQSALLNLAVNARDAMPDGGCLTFSTTPVELDDAFCRRLAMPTTPGTYAQIRVADTGVGMDPEMSKRVFEPFFTTKEIGRGTGLGLAAVYGTVKSHGGSIEVRSSPGEGSTFTLYLPVTRPRVAAHPTPPEGTWLEGRGTLLLVDDQPEVRRVTANILERLGYVVLSADDGVSALEVFDRERERIRLVLLDVRMPRMDGAETLRRLRKIAPNLPVVIVSGFGADKDLETIRAIGVQAVVEKPFTVAELSEAVARALDRA